MNDRQSSTTSARLAAAIPRLLDAEDRAATLGHSWLRRLAIVKAIEAATSLRDEALDRAGAFNLAVRS